MNLNMKCTDSTELAGDAITQSSKADSSSWSAWAVIQD